MGNGKHKPGPTGLHAKGGGTATAPSMADQIVGYVRRQSGTRVGDGECFTLANRALQAAHAKSARDYGTVTPTADYTWGAATTLANLQPGDVIQFRDYGYERKDVTETDRETKTTEHSERRPHHTAIVQSVDGNGAVTVVEQNSPVRSAVRRTQLFFTSRSFKTGNTTTTITVDGTVWFYRPEAR
jgi:hypothetical protein